MAKQTSQKTETAITQIIKEIEFGRRTTIILDRIPLFVENIEKRVYTDEEFADFFPICAGKSYQELKHIRKEVYKRLSEDIKNPSNTMLSTYRMYIALCNLYPKKKVPLSNLKIKLCKELWFSDLYTDFRQGLKMAILMDSIISDETNHVPNKN